MNVSVVMCVVRVCRACTYFIGAIIVRIPSKTCRARLADAIAAGRLSVEQRALWTSPPKSPNTAGETKRKREEKEYNGREIGKRGDGGRGVGRDTGGGRGEGEIGRGGRGEAEGGRRGEAEGGRREGREVEEGGEGREKAEAQEGRERGGETAREPNSVFKGPCKDGDVQAVGRKRRRDDGGQAREQILRNQREEDRSEWGGRDGAQEDGGAKVQWSSGEKKNSKQGFNGAEHKRHEISLYVNTEDSEWASVFRRSGSIHEDKCARTERDTQDDASSHA